MTTKRIVVSLICFFAIENGAAQQKAQRKCSQFVFGPTLTVPRHTNVVGGTPTSQNEFPHMAALGYGSTKNPEWLCGGTLISDQFVLTAAHCSSARNLGTVKVVRLGTRSLSPRLQSDHQDIEVDRVIQNPNYNSPSSYNDIALVRLRRRVQFSASVLPACLNTASNVNLATNTFIALGWGKTDFAGPTSDDLLKVDLRMVNRNDCSKSYKTEEKLSDGIRDAIQMCAGGELQKDTCQGDSGGPLEYKNGKFHYIVGVTSFGKACGITKTPGVYTRVSAFIPWIESVVWP